MRVQRATLPSRIGLAVGLAAVVVLALGPLWALDSVLRDDQLPHPARPGPDVEPAGRLRRPGLHRPAGLRRALGAYGLLFFADTLGLPLLVSVLVAGVVGTLVAVPTALLAFRLRGGYFAIGTWVIAEVYRLVITNVSQLGGGSGLTLRAASAFDRTTRLYLTYELALAVGVGAVALTYLLLRRRLGLALTAIRDSEPAAQSLGVPVFRTKFAVYLVAAFGCSLAGAVIYLNLLRVQPEAAFSVNWTAFMIFIVVIGGVGTIEGPIIGTIVFFVLQETLSGYGAWYLVLLGAVGPGHPAGPPGPVGPGGRPHRLEPVPGATQTRGALMAHGSPTSTRSPRLAKVSYLATPMIANVAFLADRLEKPVLAEGRPGWARPSWPRPWPPPPGPGSSGSSATRALTSPRPCTSGTTRSSCCASRPTGPMTPAGPMSRPTSSPSRSC